MTRPERCERLVCHRISSGMSCARFSAVCVVCKRDGWLLFFLLFTTPRTAANLLTPPTRDGWCVYSFIYYPAAFSDNGGIFVHDLTPVPNSQESNRGAPISFPLTAPPKQKKGQIVTKEKRGGREPVQFPVQLTEPQNRGRPPPLPKLHPRPLPPRASSLSLPANTPLAHPPGALK